MHHINQTSESQQMARAVETADHQFTSIDRMPLGPSERLIALQPRATQHGTNQYLARNGPEEVTAEPESSQFQSSPKFLAQIQRRAQFRQPQPSTSAEPQRQTQEQQQANVQSFEQYDSSRSILVEPAEQGHRLDQGYQRLLAAQQSHPLQGQNPGHQGKSLAAYHATLTQYTQGQIPDQGIPTRGGPQNQSSMMSQGNDGGAIANYYNPGDMSSVDHNDREGGNHNLQDYQMQVMLLEQQNKKRFMMARQEQDNMMPRTPGEGPPDGTTPTPPEYDEEADELANGMAKRGRVPPAPEENTTLEDIPHTHHTISEDQTASSGFMRDRLYALDSNPDQPQPVAFHFVENQVSAQSDAPAKPITPAYPKNFSGPHKPQNQKQQPSLMAQRQMAPYQQGIHRDTSSPKIHRQALQQADKEQETRRLPPIDSVRNLAPNIASTMETQLFRGNDRVRNRSTEDKGSRGNLVENPGTTSTSLGDIDLLQQLRERIQELEAENSDLRQGKTPEKPKEDASQINVQIFHSLTDDGIVYLSQPDWEIHGEEVILRGHFPISDPEGYVENKGNVAFIVYKSYNVKHQRVLVDEAMKTKQPLPDPEPAKQHVLLNSEEMIEAVEAFFAQYPTFRTDFPEVEATEQMASPFIWWYHCRKSHNIQRLPDRQTKLVATLTNWIEVNYSLLYNQIDHQFRRGKVSNASVEYLIRPGDVLISDSKGIPVGHLATSCPFLDKPRSSIPGPKALLRANEQHKLPYQWYWDVLSYSYTYAGDFFQDDMTLRLTFETETEDGEIDIASMGVVPLKYASREVCERLERRGKAFWKYRHKQLVSYEGSSPKRKYAVRTIFHFFPLSCFYRSTYLRRLTSNE
jgi:hypothetical protein